MGLSSELMQDARNDLLEQLDLVARRLVCGCGNHGCCIAKPEGQGTNGACRCTPRAIGRDLKFAGERLMQLHGWD